MSDLQIDATTGVWDLAIVDGDLVMVDDVSRAAEVTQRVIYRLMTWRGESVYDKAAGLPYLDGIFGFEPVPDVVGLLNQTVIETDGVTELIDATYTLDDGVLAYSVAIRVDDGTEVEISGSVTA